MGMPVEYFQCYESGLCVESSMVKKFSLVVCIVVLTSPFLVSADQLSDLRGQLEFVQRQLQRIAILGTDAACVAIAHDFSMGATDANTGGDVTKLQQFLAKDLSIYPEGVVTGYFGPATSRALQRWQIRHDITITIPGIGAFGPKTRKAMMSGQECGDGSVSIDEALIEGENSFTLGGSAVQAPSFLFLVPAAYQGKRNLGALRHNASNYSVAAYPGTASYSRWSAAFSGVPSGTYTVLAYSNVGLDTEGYPKLIATASLKVSRPNRIPMHFGSEYPVTLGVGQSAVVKENNNQDKIVTVTLVSVPYPKEGDVGYEAEFRIDIHNGSLRDGAYKYIATIGSRMSKEGLPMSEYSLTGFEVTDISPSMQTATIVDYTD